MRNPMNIFRNPLESHVRDLLAESNLPSSDLSSTHLQNFWGCGSVEALKGIIGLEIYGDVALLRSLAVAVDSRGHGYGKALVAQAERYAQSQGVSKIYLLTTTAEEFFDRLGYMKTNRDSAPVPIRQTQEFSSLCPSSSVFMVKVLPANMTLNVTGAGAPAR
jgi:amino-acid N-acetyltransferase